MKSLLLIIGLIISLEAEAKMITKVIEYKDGDATLEGYFAYDTAVKSPLAEKGKRPGIVVVHDWLGVGPYVKHRVEMLASLGYAAFAADIYGKGVRPNNPKDASATATIYKTNLKLMRERVNAALRELKKQEVVSATNVAAMGYCFGGTTALELARSGAPIKGVVSFHGGLGPQNPKDALNIKAKVLALHGADDPFVKEEEVKAFEQEMREAKVDWQLVKYSGAVHSFTNPEAGNDNSKGAAYNKSADERSWIAMKDFFAEIFPKQ